MQEKIEISKMPSIYYVSIFLAKWGEENSGKRVMLFNEDLMEKLSKEIKETANLGILLYVPSRIKRLYMYNLIVEWYNVGGEKAILYRLTNKVTGKQIYNSPKNWLMGDDECLAY